ncbi:MAG TPA: glycosyltransferase family 9 protein [Candidatus Brocadiia bacterium]|nr:glycosyltransferase family 9 protein [Candidatus Brocadiia bacterium]
MAFQCPTCGRQYDATLFEFGRKIVCECGTSFAAERGHEARLDPPERVRRVLIVRPGAVGDFILTLPAIEAIHRLNPGAEIVLMTYPSLAELAMQSSWTPAGAPYASDFLDFGSARYTSLFGESAVERADLKSVFRSFDRAVIFATGNMEWFAGHLRGMGIGDISLASAKPSPDVHMADLMLSETVGPGKPPAIPRLMPFVRSARIAQEILDAARLRRPFALLHPGSGGRSKRAPAGLYADLAVRLRNAGLDVVVSSGPADAEAMREFAIEAKPGSCHMLRQVGLAELATVAACAAVFVGNDSGISHLAAAAGCPTLALFGPTDPAQWAPRGDRVMVLRAEGFAARNGRNNQAGWDSLKNDLVFNSAEMLLKNGRIEETKK